LTGFAVRVAGTGLDAQSDAKIHGEIAGFYRVGGLTIS
jgi:hypothetical protein